MNKIISLYSALRYSRQYEFNQKTPVRTTVKYIIFAPGSGLLEKHKRWPAENFSFLGKKILKEHPNLSILIVGSVEETSLCLKVLNSIVSTHPIFKSRINSINNIISIKDIFKIYSKALMAIVNCNGGSHIAGSLGIPVVGLYGPTNWQITGPLNKKFYPVVSKIGCSPCYSEKNPYGCEDPKCMNLIPVDEVWKLVNSLLIKSGI